MKKTKYLPPEKAWELYLKGCAIEVNCPWWANNHWEDKLNAKSLESFWPEANYRIKKT